LYFHISSAVESHFIELFSGTEVGVHVTFSQMQLWFR